MRDLLPAAWVRRGLETRRAKLRSYVKLDEDNYRFARIILTGMFKKRVLCTRSYTSVVSRVGPL